MGYHCVLCDRSFSSPNALGQHRRDSALHAPSFDCATCNRSFRSEDALEKHIRHSNAHAPSFDCDICNRSFRSENALKQHLRSSPVHAVSSSCETCNRSFSTKDALDQHLRDSDFHRKNTETPLDAFFRSFPGFNYDPFLAPAISYANLREHEGWRRGHTESNDAWNNYQKALESELYMWYGAEDDLTAWQALCRAIGIKPLPKSCEQCEEAARRTHVNIVDLIEWGRSSRGGNVQTFRNVEELRAYTKETGKIFRNTFGQGGDSGNIVLRHLLRKIFRGGL